MRLIRFGYNEDTLAQSSFIGIKYIKVVYLYYGFPPSKKYATIKKYPTDKFQIRDNNYWTLLENWIIEQ
jgi:hypothetical protein